MSDRFDAAWANAGTVHGPQGGDLLTLANRRGELPGAVFFESWPEDDGTSRQHVLTKASVALCPCGRRRLMLPSPPPAEIYSREPRTVGEGSPVIFGPRAGDLQAAFGLIVVANGRFYYWRNPFLAGGTFATITRMAGVSNGFPLANIKGFIDIWHDVGGTLLPVCQIACTQPDANRLQVYLDGSLQVYGAESVGEIHHFCADHGA